jgi:hypothetical protein
LMLHPILALVFGRLTRCPAKPNDRYQYVITNRGGENNDDSQFWYRADAHALQVESSSSEARSYIVPPFPSDRPVSIPHLSTNSSFTSSMSARSRATMTAPMSATIPLPSSISSPNSTTYATLASMPSNSYQLTPSKAAPAEQGSYMAPLISTLSPTSTPPIPPKLSPNSSN